MPSRNGTSSQAATKAHTKRATSFVQCTLCWAAIETEQTHRRVIIPAHVPALCSTPPMKALLPQSWRLQSSGVYGRLAKCPRPWGDLPHPPRACSFAVPSVPLEWRTDAVAFGHGWGVLSMYCIKQYKTHSHSSLPCLIAISEQTAHKCIAKSNTHW